ncbi:MAG: hypothetical protein ACO24G_05500 [Burkholderiaceae bacterium]
MNTRSGEIGILERRQFIGYASCLAALGGLVVTGCTPRLNWREVRDPQGLWTASFPAKPVSFRRTFPLPLPVENQARVISLTLWAALIDEQRFTLGVAEPQESLSQEALQGLAQGLEEAMLRNLEGMRAPQTAGAPAPNRQAGRFTATGRLRLTPQAAPVPALLHMQTWVRPPYVIEAKVVGPTEGFEEEAAEQFLSSVMVGQARG